MSFPLSICKEKQVITLEELDSWIREKLSQEHSYKENRLRCIINDAIRQQEFNGDTEDYLESIYKRILDDVQKANL